MVCLNPQIGGDTSSSPFFCFRFPAMPYGLINFAFASNLNSLLYYSILNNFGGYSFFEKNLCWLFLAVAFFFGLLGLQILGFAYFIAHWIRLN